MFKPINLNVLDKGFVRLESCMGGDQAVLRSARVSYGSESTDGERDKKLICYLLSHDHGTPFEHTAFTFHVKLPIFVARQWIRHRIGVSFNEVSARYTEAKDEFYIPKVWRAQDTKNKQGSHEANLNHWTLSSILEDASEGAMNNYRALLAHGVAREMARLVLPVNFYTEWYFTCNARSLINFIRLRSDGHAQWETRQYSHAMSFIFREIMPWSFEAMLNEMAVDEKIGKRNYGEMYNALGLYSKIVQDKNLSEIK